MSCRPGQDNNDNNNACSQQAQNDSKFVKSYASLTSRPHHNSIIVTCDRPPCTAADSSCRFQDSGSIDSSFCGRAHFRPLFNDPRLAHDYSYNISNGKTLRSERHFHRHLPPLLSPSWCKNSRYPLYFAHPGQERGIIASARGRQIS